MIDTCQAASMYEKFYSPNILAVASSLVGEDSLSVSIGFDGEHNLSFVENRRVTTQHLLSLSLSLSIASRWSRHRRLHHRSVHLLRAWVPGESGTAQLENDWGVRKFISSDVRLMRFWGCSVSAPSVPEASVHLHCGCPERPLRKRPAQGANHRFLRVTETYRGFIRPSQHYAVRWRVSLLPLAFRSNCLKLSFVFSSVDAATDHTNDGVVIKKPLKYTFYDQFPSELFQSRWSQ